MALDINLDVIKKMPPKQKVIAIAVLYLILTVAYYFLVLESSFEKKGTLQTKLSELQTQVTEKQRIAAQKNKYIRELSELNETLKAALTKLPDQREIPGLLYSVAQAGRESGIDFILFEPKPAEKKQPEAQPAAAKPADKKPDDKGPPPKPVEEKFYEDIPVKVSITGTFQNMAIFFERVARLPRIINIEDIAMEGKDIKGRRLISINCVVKTYMFLEKMGAKKADEKK